MCGTVRRYVWDNSYDTPPNPNPFEPTDVPVKHDEQKGARSHVSIISQLEFRFELRVGLGRNLSGILA